MKPRKKKLPSRPLEAAAEALWRRRVTAPSLSIAIFTRQLAAMLRNGVSLIQALETLSHQGECPDFGEVICCLIEGIGQGEPLSGVCRRFPRVFPVIYVTMLKVGESTGALDDSLDRLAEWLERDHKVRQRVQAALTYPAFVLGVAALLTLLMFYCVLPGFVSILRDHAIALPPITLLVVFLTDAIRSPGAWLVTLGVGLVGGSLARDAFRDPERFCRLYRTLLLVPAVGPMLRSGALARYCAALETMLTSGLQLSQSFELAAEASGDPLLRSDARRLVDAVIDGQQVSEPMRERKDLYPPGMVQMVVAGEQASKLPAMFERLAAYYEIDTSYRVDTLSAALEPMLLAGVSGVVGTLIMSIFLPMYAYLAKLG